jgi:hypothetical protein
MWQSTSCVICVTYNKVLEREIGESVGDIAEISGNNW